MLKHFPGRLFVALVPTGVFIALVLNAGIAVAAVSPGGDIRAQENRATRVNELINILRHPDEAGRAAAAEALGRIGPMAAAAVPALTEALRTAPEPGVRRAAAFALGGIGPTEEETTTALIEAVRDTREPLVRAEAAFALGRIGPAATTAVVSALAEALRAALEPRVRRAAAWALGRIIGPATAAAVLIEALRADPEPRVRQMVSEALGGIGPAATVPALIEALEDPSITWAAAADLAKTAIALQYAGATGSLAELRRARDALMALPREVTSEGIERYTNIVRQAIDDLERQQRLQWIAVAERTIAFVNTYPVWVACIAAYPLLILALLLLFWLRPLALLGINDALRPYTDFALPASLGGVKIPLRHLLLVGFFHHRPRVLDAWVEAHVASVRQRFAERDTVRDREIHIDVPVVFDGKAGVELNGRRLRPAFARRITCLLLQGEGGAGKTSLACRIARWAMADDPAGRLCDHRMLPVLIEQELDGVVPEGRDPLREAVGRQLQELADEPDPIAPDLLERLLRHRRVLVIVDHLSEMSVTTRARIRPEAPDFPANALIVTSRLEETLSGVGRTVIQPPRLDGNGVSYFLETYLIRRDARALFDLEEYFESCRRLAAMVGERAITVLLAKLYAEQMVATKESGGNGRDLPDTIPDLMVGYLNELNRGIPEADKLNDRLVHRDAKALAWECLKEAYRPSSTRIEDALAVLCGEDAEFRLRYLEDRLRLVRTIPPTKNRIQFLLDPLAEYLAGLNRIEAHGADEEAWRQFLAGAEDKEGAPETIRGFLLAVHDCCLAKGKEARVPTFVERELARRAALDLETLKRARLRQRIQRLIANLSLPDAADRKFAASALGQIGPAAAAAVPMLVKALRDDPEAEVRAAAATALSGIGPAAAVPMLAEALRAASEPGVRRAAAEALGGIGPMAAAAVPALTEALRTAPEPGVRTAAALGLSGIGPPAAAAVPMLAEALGAAPEPEMRWAAAFALGGIGPAAAAAVPALAEALRTASEPGMRWAAAFALGGIGPPAAAAVPMLAEALGAASEPGMRWAATAALGQIGPAAAAAVPALAEALRNPLEPGVRTAAAEALGGIGPAAAAAVPALAEALRTAPEAEVRAAAAAALGGIGPAAAAALAEALRGALESGVRRAAVEALRRIGLGVADRVEAPERNDPRLQGVA